MGSIRKILGLLIALVVSGALLAPSALAAKGGGRTKPSATADTTAPTIAISSPAAGATVSGVTNVTGTASDDTSVSSVAVAVDGAYTNASGTSSWSSSVNTASYANGAHTLSARATDAAGNTSVTSRTVTFSNATPDTTAPSVNIGSPANGSTVSGTITVSGTSADNVSVSKVETSVDGGAYSMASGTTSWSRTLDTTTLSNGSHTISARATDTSNNVRSTSVSVTVSNSTGGGGSSAPNTQGQWVSPEGLTIKVQTSSAWTISQIYTMLKAGQALDLDKIGPRLMIFVQDAYSTTTSSWNAQDNNGVYNDFGATMYLKGAGDAFAYRPDDTLHHEYGHVWAGFQRYLGHQGDWTSYLQARGLYGDPRLGTGYSWTVDEIIADDYRLLFGSSAAISERPTHLNPDIPDPRNVAGLRTFMGSTWRTA